MHVKALVTLAAPAALILGALAAPAVGQIDNRVNRGNYDTGHLNDANPMIGSGGYNLSRPGFDSGLRANSIITGNVTGLGGFHGFSPIQQNNAFRDNLPSSGLSEFNRRSVGLDSLRSNRNVAGPTLFYDPQRTISDIGYIRRGLNQPGSSTVNSPYFTPPSLANTTQLQSQPQLQDPLDLRMRYEAAKTNFGVSRRPNAAADLWNDGFRTSIYDTVGQSSIFGPRLSEMNDEARQHALTESPGLLNRDVRNFSRLPEVGREQIEPALDDENRTETAQAPNFGTTRIPLKKDESTPSTARGTPGAITPPDLNARQTSVGQRPQPGPPTAVTTDTGLTLGADRFADLYSAVNEALKGGDRRLGFRGRSLRAPESGAQQPTVDQPSGDATPGGIRPPEGDPTRPPTAPDWARNVLLRPVTSFAGSYENQLNQRMAKGEAALHKGDYFTASREFKMAETIDPENPLPVLARGHALLAAGEYVSAARQLIRGIQRFPHIAAFELDLPSLVGRKDVFDLRRAELEERLKDMEDADLRFLLGYTELYSGLPELGLANLEKAAGGTSPDSPVRQFLDHVRGQRELPDLPK